MSHSCSLLLKVCLPDIGAPLTFELSGRQVLSVLAPDLMSNADCVPVTTLQLLTNHGKVDARPVEHLFLTASRCAAVPLHGGL